MKRLTQAQSEVNEAKAVIEKLKQSKAEARAEEENSKRAHLIQQWCHHRGPPDLIIGLVTILPSAIL